MATMNFKYTSVLSVCLLLLLSFTGCYKDRSTPAVFVNNDPNAKDPRVGYITIDSIRKSYIYSALEQLEIKPLVESSFEDDDLEYQWTLYSQSDPKKKRFEIGTDKNLSYAITIAPGRYTGFLEVRSKSSDLSSSASFQLFISRFKGFFVLKETAEGSKITEVDSYSIPEDGSENVLNANIMEPSLGRKVEGTPAVLDVSYNRFFLDPDSLAAGVKFETVGHLASVLTKEGDIYMMQTRNFKEVMPKTGQRFYLPIEGTPKYYRNISSVYSTLLLSDIGVFKAVLHASFNNFTRPGFFSKPIFDSYDPSITFTGSPHLFGTSLGYAYWDPKLKAPIFGFDAQMSTVDVDAKEESVQGIDPAKLNVEPIFGGAFYGSGANEEATFFLFRSLADKKHYLYYFTPKQGWGTLTKREEVTSAKLKTATLFAVNSGRSVSSAPYLYYLSGNKVYAYNIQAKDNDREIRLPGMGTDEKITYMGCQYFFEGNSDPKSDFDYFIVATQKGNTYTVYMYSLLGGIPDGEPKIKFSGEGRFVDVQYASPDYTNRSSHSVLYH